MEKRSNHRSLKKLLEIGMADVKKTIVTDNSLHICMSNIYIVDYSCQTKTAIMVVNFIPQQSS